jgi:hypothetical protein
MAASASGKSAGRKGGWWCACAAAGAVGAAAAAAGGREGAAEAAAEGAAEETAPKNSAGFLRLSTAAASSAEKLFWGGAGWEAALVEEGPCALRRFSRACGGGAASVLCWAVGLPPAAALGAAALGATHPLPSALTAALCLIFWVSSSISDPLGKAPTFGAGAGPAEAAPMGAAAACARFGAAGDLLPCLTPLSSVSVSPAASTP